MPGIHIPRCASCLWSTAKSTVSQCRAYSTEVLRGKELGPIEQDEYQTFRVRKHGKSLPLPPALDPIKVEQKFKWQQTKKKPDVHNFTPFQKKIWKNPHAHALASPIRFERVNSVLLPSSLLLSLHLRRNPTSNQPWALPLSLTTSSKAYLGPPYRILGHQYVVAALSRKKLFERSLPAQYLNGLSKPDLESIVWRPDMPALIHSLLQDRVVDKLAWYFRRRSGHLVPVASPRAQDIDGVDDVSSVLIFRSLKSRADEMHEEMQDIVLDCDRWAMYYLKGFSKQIDIHVKVKATHRPPIWVGDPLVPRLQPRARFPPLEYKTAVWRGKKVALYSLTDHLGEEKAQELIKGSRYENEGCLVIKSSRHNIPVQLLLMQLENYVAKSAPI